MIIGVDPAWTVEDNLEIMLRQGLYSKSLATLPRNDNDVEVVNLIARLEDEHEADAVFVDAAFSSLSRRSNYGPAGDHGSIRNLRSE